MVDVGDDDNGVGAGDDDVYRGRMEPVLVLLSDSYPNDKTSVSDSRPSVKIKEGGLDLFYFSFHFLFSFLFYFFTFYF